MKWIRKILKEPYPYYIPFNRSIKLLVFFSAVIPAFLIVFKPFGIQNSSCEWLTIVLVGLSVPIFLTLAINFYGFPKIFPGLFNEHSWSIGNEVVWSLWNFFTIVFVTGFYWTVVPVCSSSSIHWMEQLSRAFLIGLIPGMTCIYFNYSHALKTKLKKANDLNQKLQSRISYYEHGKLNLVADNDSDVINLSTDNLVLIQAYDNYAKIILDKSGKISNHLIRSSLKLLETQISYPFIVRCHRSFIINLAKLEAVEGNARDFKLKLQNYNEWVPVSREAYKNITALFKDYAPKTPVSFSFDKSSTQQL